MNELPIHTPFERIFLNTTKEHFNKYPRDWQLRVGGRIISDICEKREIRQLCVQPTGSGKSLLFQTIATFLKGITICLTPLLSLGADQVNKLMINTRSEDTTITALHLDECDHGDIPEIMGLIKNMKDNSTLFIFCSPQSIKTLPKNTSTNTLVTGSCELVVGSLAIYAKSERYASYVCSPQAVESLYSSRPSRPFLKVLLFALLRYFLLVPIRSIN